MAENDKPRESTRLYKELFSHIETGLAILCLENCDDPRSLRLIAANPAARRAAGLSGDECEGKLLVDAAPKLFKTGMAQACAEVVRGGQARDLGQMESSEQGISGAVFGVKALPLPDDCAAVIFEDISEHERAGDALQKPEKATEAARAMIAVVDRNYRYLLTNSAFLKYRGMSREQVVGRTTPEVMGKDVFEGVIKKYLDACFQGETVQYVMRRTHADLGERDMLISYIPIEGPAGIDRVACVIHDITEYRRAHEALEQAAKRFELASSATQDALFDWDLVSYGIWRNENYQRLFGAPERSLESDNWWLEHVHPNDRERVLAAQQAALGGDGNLFSSEFRLRRPDGSYAHVVERSLIVRDARGQVVRMIGSLTDLSERKRAEEALQESEEKHRRLFEHMSSGVTIYQAIDDGEDFVIKDFNSAAERIEHVDRKAVIGRRVTEVFPGVREFGLFSVFQKVWKTGQPAHLPSAVYRDERGPGTWRENWVYKLPSGELVAVYNDITERVQAEDALRESQRRLELIARASNTGLWDWDLRTNLVYYSPEWKSQIGYAGDEISNRLEEWETRVHPEDFPGAIGRVRDYLANPQGEFESEFRFRHKDGSYRWILGRASALKDDHGKSYRMLGSHLDITERKRAEEALRESEERFRSLVENATVGIYRTTPDGHILMVNPALVRMLGFNSSEELAARNLECEGFPSSYPRRAFRERIEREGQVIGLESAWVRRDGEVNYFRESARVVRAGDGRVLYYDGIVEDITERKRAEEASRESEERYRTLFENSPVGIYRTTADGRILAGNPAFAQMLGYSSSEELASRNLNAPDFEPQYSRAQFTEKLEKEGRITGLESEWHRRDGSVIFVRENARAIQDEAGRILYYEGTAEDITERKQAEEALRESEQFNREVIANAQEGVAVYDREFRYQVWNRFMEELTGVPASEVLGKHAFDLFPHLREQKLDLLIRRALAGEVVHAPDTPFHVPATGKSGWVSNVYSPHFGTSGQIRGVIGTIRDITERKRAEQALRESEARFRTVFENAGIGMGLVGIDGNSIETNLATQRMLGYSELELKQMPNSQYTHPDDAHLSWDMFRELAEGKRDRYQLEKRYIRKDGQIVWGRLTESLVRNQNGEPQYAVAMMEDITDRKRAEEALRESEARFRAVFEKAGIGIALIDMHGRPVESNPALLKMLGYGKQELAQMAFTEYTHPSDVQADCDLFAELVEGKRDQYQLEKRFYRKDGEVVWGELTASVVRDQNGDPSYAVGMVEDITERKRAEAALRQLSGRILRLQDEERRRIARELHETTAQSLAALAMNLSVVKDAAPDLSARARACLSESLELAEKCSREVRSVSYLLHPPLPDEAGLGSALRWFIDGYTQRTGIHVDLEVPPGLTRLPGDVELALYRVVQEGLTNIRLHSGSKKARVCLECRPDQAVLTVADEGRGMPPGLLERMGRHGGELGVGIPGMRERIRQLGGQLEIVTGSKGTTLTAIMPLREEPA
jgi:PAS domain S-box-containing protein